MCGRDSSPIYNTLVSVAIFIALYFIFDIVVSLICAYVMFVCLGLPLMLDSVICDSLFSIITPWIDDRTLFSIPRESKSKLYTPKWGKTEIPNFQFCLFVLSLGIVYCRTRCDCSVGGKQKFTTVRRIAQEMRVPRENYNRHFTCHIYQPWSPW